MVTKEKMGTPTRPIFDLTVCAGKRVLGRGFFVYVPHWVVYDHAGTPVSALLPLCEPENYAKNALFGTFSDMSSL